MRLLFPVIGLFANATGNKRLEQAWWRELLERLPAGTSSTALVEIVPAFGRSLLDDRYPAFFCTDLRKLAATLSALDVLVTGDCGVMHLACAAGVPGLGEKMKVNRASNSTCRTSSTVSMASASVSPGKPIMTSEVSTRSGMTFRA